MYIEASNLKRKLFFIVFDSLIIFMATYIAFLLRFDFHIPLQYNDSIIIVVAALISIRIFLFNYFQIYNISWRYFGFNDTTKLIYVTVLSTLFLLIIAYLLRFTEYVIPRSIIPIEFFISLFLILGLRIFKRLYLETAQHSVDKNHTLIVADLEKANQILRAINTKDSLYKPIAIINNSNHNMKVNNVNIYTFEEFSSLDIVCDVAIVDETENITVVYNQLLDIGITEIKISSAYGDYGALIKDVSVEDLLARKPQDLDKSKIKHFLHGKVVLVTGAGGSIGSEICRQCKIFGVKSLILLDNSEYNLYNITEEITEIQTYSVMHNIVNKKDLEMTFSRYKPDIVIHAAAYKQVPLVEANIDEGIVNNVLGTKNIIDTSIEYGVEKFVMISTDKAVRPANVMGTTKRICELYAQNSNGQGTDIVAVRFGNVLGSSGSVIPKFKKQIQEGKNITVTHPDISRYFMLIPEACELVLQAGAIGSGGEIFILDMGEPIKIVDLAQKMIELSGKPNINIEFTGLRPGEKLYEELLIDDTDTQTDYESITVAKPTQYSIEKLNKDIEELLNSSDKLSKLKEIVPEFNHQKNI